MSAMPSMATESVRRNEPTRCAISRHWDHRCDRASRGNEFTLALGLDFGLGGRILSGTEFCLTARNTASARLSSKRTRTRIELAFRVRRVSSYGQSAPRPHEIANGEIEADEHHERDKPLNSPRGHRLRRNAGRACGRGAGRLPQAVAMSGDRLEVNVSSIR
jgi:hypothetical protein